MEPEEVPYIDVFLRFPDAATALVAAKALGFAGDDAEELPRDGIWHNDEGEGFYFVLDVVFGDGTIYDENGTVIPGFHINGRWRGPAEKMPDFGPALILPDNPACVFA